MAIYHLSMKPISRGTGRSAVAASAYRSGSKLTNDRDGLTHDFTRKQGIEHSEIVLPDGSKADWARDREALWNAAEFAENRKDARVAREFEVALPHELNDEQRLALTRQFAQSLADRHGAAVDFAIHSPHGETDVRNHHAHIMMTTREVTPDGLGEKTSIERENKWLLNNDMPTSHMQLKAIRQSWEDHGNEHLARAGHDIRIDHRSYQARGLEIEPTQHMGVQATQMERRGQAVTRQAQEQESARRNAELIREKPDEILTLITGEKSVFDRHDVARALHRYIDDPEVFQDAFAKVMASPSLVELQAEKDSSSGLARYSTHEMVETEMGMSVAADRMSSNQSHSVQQNHVTHAVDRQNAAIQKVAGANLSDEQHHAIEYVTGPEQISVVVGYAGAGKSTLLAAAREAWEAEGYRVHGSALSGKAAEGLEESSGIQSRTLASWEYGWKSGRDRLRGDDVFVIDEAGMVGSKQLAGFIGEAEKRGAKVVLVGDHEQLQSIGAGAAFRAISEQVGHVQLSEIRRQRSDWQREASVAFATHKTADALTAYEKHGALRLSETKETARQEIVRDYLSDREQHPEGSRVALAHRRVDVRKINSEIRSALQERGELARGEESGELRFQTNDGERSFAKGDRIVFLENNRDLDVKNGMLGTVEALDHGRITASLEGRDRSVSVSVADYAALDHGYATTIHKSQGATVDRAFVMASSTMDRHLSYVSLTRHRDEARLYAGQDEFKDQKHLKATLSRSGAKESTLDYVQGFAAQRGIADNLGIKSEIKVERFVERQSQTVEDPMQSRGSSEKRVEDLERKKHGRDPQPPKEEPQRRGMFDGLKLRRGSKPTQETVQPRIPDNDRLQARSLFEKSVDRYARAYIDAGQADRAGLPVLESQKQELQKAGQELDKIRPGSARHLRSAFDHDPKVYQDATELQGQDRANQLVKAIEQERQFQADPNIRAERAISQWQRLDRERQGLRGIQHKEDRQRIEADMRTVANTIKDDPQVEKVVRDRAKELGISHIRQGQNITAAMEQKLSRGRDMGSER